jgi:hypothetical protein
MAIFNSYVSLPEGSSWISLGMFFGSVVTWVTERPIFVEARNMKHGNGKSIVHRWFSLWNIGASPKHEDTGRVHHYPMTDHIGSMYAIYGNIYHQYTPNVSIYTSTMDPMGMIRLCKPLNIFQMWSPWLPGPTKLRAASGTDLHLAGEPRVQATQVTTWTCSWSAV